MLYTPIPLIIGSDAMSGVNKEERTSTSIKIRPTVWRDAKIAAINENITVSELVEEAITCWITEQAKKK